MMTIDTVRTLLEAGADDAVAIAAPGRRPLDYAGLRAQADGVVATLHDRRLGRNDRIAIVLPNGPEMAVAFVCVASGCTTAPLNPAYRADEFEFYLADLDAKGLLVEAGSDSPAIEIARRRGIPIIRLHADPAAPAGSFTLAHDGDDPPASQSSSSRSVTGDRVAAPFAEADDVALVLHTSGTTSRPKMVPLSQRNVTASAGHIRATLALDPGDRCLNVMPLFHIHGLIGATLASLSAGASVFCAPGFDAFKFFSWLEEARPTWYTAVPAMHQSILSRADRNAEVIAAHPLRLVRSSSASLPPQVMLRLEKTFGAPVIESYGMTEAAHQMTSNPLPPRARKPGSVGIAAGPSLAIMDLDGKLLPPGGIGEVVIQGPNVTLGYVNNPAANAEGFTSGWFRTGDQGRIDEEGYLFLTGRLKEIINRGGEKISPREVDEVLMDHPAVDQAVTFAMPHDKLGEEVAAAVVLRDGGTASERELRDFVAARLIDCKVPRKVLILSEMPKGATGKLQRIGLAEKLGLGS